MASGTSHSWTQDYAHRSIIGGIEPPLMTQKKLVHTVTAYELGLRAKVISPAN